MKTKELLQAVMAVMPGTSTKGIIEGSESIVFTDDTIFTYNDRISVSAFIDTGIKCAVVAEDLYKILKGIKDKEVQLEMEDKTLLIKSDSTEAGLSTFSNDNIMSFIEALNFDADFEILPDKFIDGLNLCQFSALNNVNDSLNLYCVKISGKYISSSDKYRASLFTLDKGVKGSVLIPKSAIPFIIDFNPEEYSFKNGWAYFIDKNDAVLSCRVVDSDKFADIVGIFKKLKTTDSFKLPVEFKEMLPEIISISDEILAVSKHIKISIKDGELICQLKKERGWLKKKYSIDTDLELTFLVSATFLSEILELTDEIHTGKGTIVIKTKQMQHMISLPSKG